jgi:hypothetical protein
MPAIDLESRGKYANRHSTLNISESFCYFCGSRKFLIYCAILQFCSNTQEYPRVHLLRMQYPVKPSRSLRGAIKSFSALWGPEPFCNCYVKQKILGFWCNFWKKRNISATSVNLPVNSWNEFVTSATARKSGTFLNLKNLSEWLCTCWNISGHSAMLQQVLPLQQSADPSCNS